MGKMAAVTLAMVALAWCTALADDAMMGKWKGSGNRIFNVGGGSGDFDLVVESPDGSRKVFKARWVKPGAQFVWTDAQNSTHTATLDKADRKRIKDVNSAYPDSTAYWYRI